MVAARAEYEGGFWAWHAAAVIAFMPFTGKRLNPATINPGKPRDPEAEARLDAVRRHMNSVMLRAMAREAFAKRKRPKRVAEDGTRKE